MKLLIVFLIVVAAFISTPRLYAKEVNELTAVEQIALEQVTNTQKALSVLENCAKTGSVNQCLEVTKAARVFQQNRIEAFQSGKVYIDQALELVQNSAAADESRLQQLQDIIGQHPKADYHYKQIIAYGQQQIEAAKKQMRPFISTVADMIRANDNILKFLGALEGKTALQIQEQLSEKQALNDMAVFKEKITLFERLLWMAVGLSSSEGDDKIITSILEHARQGSVVYQIPASAEKVTGMLPFFCEDEKRMNAMLFCEKKEVPAVRFNIDLLKKILDEKNGLAQIVVEKVWTEKVPLVELLSGFFSKMQTDPKLRTIRVEYYETHVCPSKNNPSNLDVDMLGTIVCKEKTITRKHMASRKVIEAALFDLVGEKDESLKLYAKDPN